MFDSSKKEQAAVRGQMAQARKWRHSEGKTLFGPAVPSIFGSPLPAGGSHSGYFNL